MRVIMIVATLVLMAGAACADEAADYMAAAGDEVRAYGECTMQKALPLVKSQLSADAIADQAFAACSDKRAAVAVALTGDPTHLSPEKAEQVTADVTKVSRENLIQIVTKRRN